MNFSWRIEELARRVLYYAKWHNADAYCEKNSSNLSSLSSCSPTPYLDEIERALDISHEPVFTLPREVDDNNSSRVKTCTLPNGSSRRKSLGDSVTSKVANDVARCTWTPTTETKGDSSHKSEKITVQKIQKNSTFNEANLEDMAPFSPDFYRAVGDMMREAFHPGVVNMLEQIQNDHRTPDILNDNCPIDPSAVSLTHDYSNEHNFGALISLENFSLPRMQNAVRITRILLGMQEMRVSSPEEESERSEMTFFHKLLFYCECNELKMKDGSMAHNIKTTCFSGSKGDRVPILSSLFHHWENLPQLQNGLHQISRRYSYMLPMNATEYFEYVSSSSLNRTSESNASVFRLEGTLGGKRKPSSDSSEISFLGSRALKIESFQLRLENELQQHINGKDRRDCETSVESEHGGLIELTLSIYKASDALLRGKCRKLIGQLLRIHSMGTGKSSTSVSTRQGDESDASGVFWGLGPSFASFCPLVVASSLNLTVPGISGDSLLRGKVPVSITYLKQVGAGSGVMQHHPLGMENTSACGIEALLQVLLRIILGFRVATPSIVESQVTKQFFLDTNSEIGRSAILRQSHKDLLFHVLLPLHRPSGMVLWRDQIPLIGLYHEALVKCIGALIALDPTLIGPVVSALIHPDIWPTEGLIRGENDSTSIGGGAMANTPKVVLLIHEIDTLIGSLKQVDENYTEQCLAFFEPYFLPLTSRLCACIASDNSRTCERALQLFRNEMFKRLVSRQLNDVGPLLLPALFRCSTGRASSSNQWEVPWNPTVRKMTLLVLRELEEYYKKTGGNDSFWTACEQALGRFLNEPEFSTVDTKNISVKGLNNVSQGSVVIGTRRDDIDARKNNNLMSLRASMGAWKPPSARSKQTLRTTQSESTSSHQPPLTVTGVAPWALSSQYRKNGHLTISGKPRATNISNINMTKIAPASETKQKQVSEPILPGASKTHHNLSFEKTQDQFERIEKSVIEEEEENFHISSSVKVSDSLTTSSIVVKVRQYMEKLKASSDIEEGCDGISIWAKAQMEESPVLLPNLKFHDLVFGHELGTGAFSTVKYARQIVKDRTRSSWPEFAVKIVSTEKIEELGYEKCINREIAILRTLSHPGISRMISSFRFRDGAYIVLEYASSGDLHTLIRKNGSLDHESTRFVIGSVAAALWSIHEHGFVYADCKPENILIMETGHIKITDFGACRAVTDTSKALVQESSKNLLNQLRNGDWKAAEHDTAIKSTSNSTKESDLEEEDPRIEGTIAYLPPEILIRGLLSVTADVWALGCVMFQCLTGRPPILEDNDELTAKKIVSFKINSESTDFFGKQQGSIFSSNEKAIISKMLNQDVNFRPSILQLSNDTYFIGMDIFSLHKRPPYPLNVGSIAPTNDAKWSRRQFSSIWSPQPHSYSIAVPLSLTPSNSISRDEVIVEGDEADAVFFTLRKTPILTKIQE